MSYIYLVLVDYILDYVYLRSNPIDNYLLKYVACFSILRGALIHFNIAAHTYDLR